MLTKLVMIKVLNDTQHSNPIITMMNYHAPSCTLYNVALT